MSLSYQNTFWDGVDADMGAHTYLVEATELIEAWCRTGLVKFPTHEPKFSEWKNKAVLSLALTFTPIFLSACSERGLDEVGMRRFIMDAFAAPEQLSMETLSRANRKLRNNS